MDITYENYRNLYIVFYTPQFICSTIATAIIIMLFKMLLLNEKNISAIKLMIKIKMELEQSRYIERSIKIKYILFIIFCALLLLFCWYYISCFCATYINDQILLIKYALFSFGFLLIYPFFLTLIPGLLRIPALRSEYNRCLYEVSQFLQLALL